MLGHRISISRIALTGFILLTIGAGCSGSDDTVTPIDSSNSGIVEVDGSVNLPGVEFDGWNTATIAGGSSPIEESGSFLQSVEDDRPELIICLDESDDLRLLAFSDPAGVDSSSLHMEISARSSLIASIMLAPGISSTDPEVFSNRVSILTGLEGFEALAGMVEAWAVSQSWLEVVADDRYEQAVTPLIEALVEEISTGDYKIDHSKEYYSLSILPDADSATTEDHVQVIHDGWKWVWLFREDYNYHNYCFNRVQLDGSPGSLYHLSSFLESMPGVEPVSLAGLLAPILGGDGIGDPSVIKDSIEMSLADGYAYSRYWIKGPGAQAAEEPLPVEFDAPVGEPHLATFIQYLFVPAVDTILAAHGSPLGAAVVWDLTNTVWTTLGQAEAFTDLVTVWETGNWSDVASALSSFLTEAFSFVVDLGQAMGPGESLLGVSQASWESLNVFTSVAQVAFGITNLAVFNYRMADSRIVEVETYQGPAVYSVTVTADDVIYDRIPRWSLTSPSGISLSGRSPEQYTIRLYEPGTYTLDCEYVSGYTTPERISFEIDDEHSFADIHLGYVSDGVDVLARLDFEEAGLAEWEQVDYPSDGVGSMEIVSGTLTGQGDFLLEMSVDDHGTPVNDKAAAYYLPSDAWSNYAMEFDFRLEEHTYNKMYLRFYLDGAGNTYTTGYLITLNPTADNIVLMSNITNPSTVLQSVHCAISANTVYHMHMEAQDGLIKVYLDGDLLIDVESQDFETGGFALGVGNAGAEDGRRTRFDNVVVYQY